MQNQWGGGGNSYSLEEQIVGKWINGKTLYQKVVSYNWNQTSTTPYSYPKPPNANTIIKAELMATLHSSRNQYLVTDTFLNNWNNYFVIIDTGGEIKLDYLSSSIYLTNIKIIWTYTKTTD